MAEKPLSVDAVLRIGRGICSALTGVHGEIWPSAINVDGDDVSIVPPGFEISRWGPYASPERILGETPTPQSDVFSIGAVLFHALTGRMAFHGDTPAEMMLSACATAPLEARVVKPEVPKGVSDVLTRCLSRDPEHRYATPATLRHALQGDMPQPAWPGRRVLVADDDAPVRELCALIASRTGVEADVVASGRDAISALRSRMYDVVLLDLNMPRLSGWEVLDFLRENGRARPRNLFVVTGFSDQVISNADRRLVTAVIYKPVAPDELQTLLRECLHGHGVDISAILRTTPHRIVAA